MQLLPSSASHVVSCFTQLGFVHYLGEISQKRRLLDSPNSLHNVC